MIRLSLAIALAGLLACGCARFGDACAQEVPAEQPGDVTESPSQQPATAGSENVKTPLIRALIQTLDEAKGESDEVKDSLKKALREADEDLAKVLGGKSKVLIMQANRKPPMPVVGTRYPQSPKKASAPTAAAKPEGKPAKTVEPAEEKAAESVPASQPEDAATGNPFEIEPEEGAVTPPETGAPMADQAGGIAEAASQPPMLETLLKAIDADQTQSPEAKARLKELLRKADTEMGGVLSAKRVQVRLPKETAPAEPVIRTYRRGGMKVREFHSP